MLAKIEQLKRAISTAYRYVAMVAIAGILIIMTLQAFFRYALNNSITWSEELARFMFVWASMMGAVVVTGNHGHATIKMLDEVLPATVSAVKQILFDAVALAIGAIFVFYGIKLVNSTWNQTSAALKLSYAYVYMAVPIGGAGIALESLLNCLETALKMKCKPTTEDEKIADAVEEVQE